MAKLLDTNDIIGNKYGMLTVIAYDHVKISGVYRNKYYYYRCKCECGKEAVISRNNLITHRQHSCGCDRNKKGAMLKNIVDKWDSKIDKKKYTASGNPRHGNCKHVITACAISELLHRCCHDCDRYPTCSKRCTNTPDKCRR